MSLYAWTILMNFFVYLGEGRGVVTNACICMGYIAFPTEQINGCWPNLVGMK